MKSFFKKSKNIEFDNQKILSSSFRPFVKTFYYSEKFLSDRLTSNHYLFFGKNLNFSNFLISFKINGEFVLATNCLFDLHYTGDSNALPLFCYNTNGDRTDNITDWGLEQFQTHYGDTNISKENIFHYTYAVLHNPAYRKKYELNLKREFPRLPFYEDFYKWVQWGKTLMDLHINYETAEPFALKENTYEVKAEAKRQKKMFPPSEEPEALYGREVRVKAKLKADKETGIIDIDELTFLSGVPKVAWDYKLGNRSALEWILDQYKEKKPTDPTIAEKFNTYRFADYKEHVIDLLKRVCTVSVQTINIVNEMGK